MILIKADARHIPLRDETVQCVVTSPPYWGLRDYGLDDKGIGLERTPEEYVANIVAVFREVWRVLRKDGTVWLNMGDSYAVGRGVDKNGNARSPGVMRSHNCGSYLHPANKLSKVSISGRSVGMGLKPKDLCGIPWRVAFALQADGWYLRSDIVWAKPNPMPESVRDRPTKAHEYIFLLSKSQRYYYDQEAVRESGNDEKTMREIARQKRLRGLGTKRGISEDSAVNQAYKWGGNIDNFQANGRNLRTVWTIATQPFPGAHFATFPEALAERCIKAGTSERGACPKCGAGWVRITEVSHIQHRKPWKDSKHPAGRNSEHGDSWAAMYGSTTKVSNTLGWSPSCSCDAGDPVPCIVLDPFGGSGTVARVAVKLGRRAVHLDLGYHELARNTRCTQIQKVLVE